MRTATRTDAELVLASAVDPDAFGDVFDRHARVIYRFAWRRVGSELAKDITAETFSTAFARRASFDPIRGDVLPWLFGIATNVLRKHLRVELRQLRVVRADREAVEDQIDERLDATMARKEISLALRALKPDDRDALLLFAWTDLGYEGIAQALDIPTGTVGSRLNRARRIVRAELDRAGWTGEGVDL